MIDVGVLVWTGLVAGSLHVVAGPDHLMALAPIAMNDRKRAIRLGALWGAGHGLGVALLGMLGLIAGQLIDVFAISAWSEFMVGLTLIGVGAWSLRRASRLVVHKHGHEHDLDESSHQHLHVHVGEAHGEQSHQGHTHAVLGIGLLHGSAGTGHLFGVVPALALSTSDAGIYIGSYVMSAVLSMAAFGGVVGRIADQGGQGLMRGLMSASGAVAVVLGLVWSASSWPV